MEKATRQHTKEHNARLVLKTIYRSEGISRAEIARATNLTRPTVSALVQELLEEGLVTEQGMAPSSGGKPGILLTLAPDASYILAVDLGGDDVRAALCDLRGEIQSEATRLRTRATGADALGLLYDVVGELIALSPRPVLGIGIGTPGLVDVEQGVVRHAVNLRWRELPLAELLTARFDLPVYVANDSHISALAEYTLAAPVDSPNLIGVKLDQGIGAGVVLNGQLIYGDGFGAGEVGHVVVVADGAECTCGNRGCLETVASSRAILQAAAQLAAEVPASRLNDAPMTLEAIARAAEQGDFAAQQVVRNAGRYIGIALAHLIGALSVRHIVLSGAVAGLGDGLVEAIRTTTVRRVLPGMAAATDIRQSALGSRNVLLGCAMMVLREELGIV